MTWRSILLKPPALLPAAVYGTVQRVWASAHESGLLRSDSASIPVISVGNILMGGSGKTPMVIWLAERLTAEKIRVAVISRGYKGTNRERTLIVCNGTGGRPLTDPDVSGDEPWLIASRLPDVPVLIARKRIDAVEIAAREFDCDAVILDDGFQHLQLNRNLNLVLMNGLEDTMFPHGKLREPFSALRRADAVILTSGCNRPPRPAEEFVNAVPVFRSQIMPVAVNFGAASLYIAEWQPETDVILASGIANPTGFRKTVEDLGFAVVRHVMFPDHHVFSDRELRKLISEAEERMLLVTEKDWVKLPEWFKQKPNTAALRIGITIDREQDLIDLVTHAINRG